MGNLPASLPLSSPQMPPNCLTEQKGFREKLQAMNQKAKVPGDASEASSDLKSRLQRVRLLESKIRERRAAKTEGKTQSVPQLDEVPKLAAEARWGEDLLEEASWYQSVRTQHGFLARFCKTTMSIHLHVQKSTHVQTESQHPLMLAPPPPHHTHFSSSYWIQGEGVDKSNPRALS